MLGTLKFIVTMGLAVVLLSPLSKYYANKNRKLRKGLLITLITFLFVSSFSDAIEGNLLHYPVEGVVIALRGLFYGLLITLFVRGVKRNRMRKRIDKAVIACHQSVETQAVEELMGAVVDATDAIEFSRELRNGLFKAYRRINKDKSIPIQMKLDLAKVLVQIGLVDIELPRVYAVNVDVLSVSDQVLRVAQGSLEEAQSIVKMAPNACVFSCRKYAENLTKYLLREHGVSLTTGEEEDNFATLLHKMNEKQMIEDKSIVNAFYEIKTVGNDAAHEQLVDVDTAQEILDLTLEIECWFRLTYEVELEIEPEEIN